MLINFIVKNCDFVNCYNYTNMFSLINPLLKVIGMIPVLNYYVRALWLSIENILLI